MAYSFRNLRMYHANPNDYTMNTIEFRQLRGTIDAEEATAWIDTAVGLVRYSEQANDDLVRSLRHHQFGNRAFTILDLLSTLLVPQSAQIYYHAQISAGTAERRFQSRTQLDSVQNNILRNLILHVEGAEFHDRNPEAVISHIRQRQQQGKYGG